VCKGRSGKKTQANTCKIVPETAKNHRGDALLPQSRSLNPTVKLVIRGGRGPKRGPREKKEWVNKGPTFYYKGVNRV